MITVLGRLLVDEHPNNPQALLERSRRPGRSMGSLARGLEDFLVQRRLALPTDQADRLAAGRRQRRVDAVPQPLRPAVAAFAASLVQARERARRAGTRPRADSTLDSALAIVRDLAQHLVTERGKQDWALTDVHDVETFLARLPKARSRRLTVLQQFFRFARVHRLVLVDPTTGLTGNTPHGFQGSTLTLGQQRALFQRWTINEQAHPHEALLGILALLHGAASHEVRLLLVSDVDQHHHTVRLGERPHPVPLDPATWTVLQRALTYRASQGTDNPHLMVTRGTKAGRGPASIAYVSHVLDSCGHSPRAIRCTRLADLVHTLDPKLVAAAFGMDPQATIFYLADHIAPTLEANL